MPYVITEACIRDGACAQVCPVEAISPGPEGDPQWPTYFINPDTCIDCGACAPECPVEAIYPEDEVPAELQEWIEKNRAFYAEGPGRGA